MKIVTNFAIAFVTLMLAGFVGPHQSVMAAELNGRLMLAIS